MQIFKKMWETSDDENIIKTTHQNYTLELKLHIGSGFL